MTHRGADALVRALAAAGVQRLFTLSGNHVMPVFDATVGTAVQLLHTRHEAAAVHMADAWARLSGEPGIALVTGGPGHANAVSALYTALMSESPLVLLSGHAPRDQLGQGAFQEVRQADMAAPVAKASWTCTGADAVAADVRRALRIARGGRPGPVHLSLPSDVLEAAVSVAEGGAAQGRGATAAGTGEVEVDEFDRVDAVDDVDEAFADAVVARLRRALRPLVLTGPAAMNRQARLRSAMLAEACDAPVVGMQSPRGINDPSLGAFAQMLAQADCVLLLGKRLDFTLRFGRTPFFCDGCEFMQIDPEAGEIDRTCRRLGDRLVIHGRAETAQAMAALLAAAGRAGHRRGSWRDEVGQALWHRPAAWDEAGSSTAGRLHPVQACRPLQGLLDSHPDSVLVCDGGEFGQWAQACLRAPNLVVNGPAGAIGVGIPFALGARLAKPHAPVVAVMGDGSVGFHIAEYDTAVRHGLPFVGVVGNDARWNAEYQIQLADYGDARAIGCELLPTRYDAVAAAFGGYGLLVEEPPAMAAAVASAQASGLPACLNVMIESVAAPVVRR